MFRWFSGHLGGAALQRCDKKSAGQALAAEVRLAEFTIPATVFVIHAPEGQNNLAQRFSAGSPEQFEQVPETRHDEVFVVALTPPKSVIQICHPEIFFS